MEVARRAAHGGFTLIELTLVIAIMSIAMVLVVSRLDNVIPSSRFISAANRIATFAEAAFSTSVASGRPVAIIYNLNEQTYYLGFPSGDFEEDPEHMDHGNPNPLPSGLKIEMLLIGDDRETAGTHVFRVSPNGRVRGHLVWITDESGRKATVEVFPLTGTTAVYEGFVEPRSEEDVE
jgi:prepilin-type N-terminal cleavage/methylation domain-containing protein